jgi:predicted amidohydrolase
VIIDIVLRRQQKSCQFQSAQRRFVRVLTLSEASGTGYCMRGRNKQQLQALALAATLITLVSTDHRTRKLSIVRLC